VAVESVAHCQMFGCVGWFRIVASHVAALARAAAAFCVCLPILLRRFSSVDVSKSSGFLYQKILFRSHFYQLKLYFFGSKNSFGNKWPSFLAAMLGLGLQISISC